MNLNEYPTVSVVIPVLNEQQRIKSCLQSVFAQHYPEERLTVMVVDGGSDDGTLDIARQFPVKILKNPDKIAEQGKAIGINHTESEFFVLLDADNTIIHSHWLEKMIYPLVEDEALLGSMSYYLDDESDFYLNRYFTLLQATDPLARFLHPKFEIEEKKEYQVFSFSPTTPPPFGSNGFVWRRAAVAGIDWQHKFEEANVMAQVVKNGYHRFAKVPGIGVHHDYVDSWAKMVKKKIKIARKFLGRKQRKEQTWVDEHQRWRFLFGVIYLGTGLGPLVEGVHHFADSGKWPWLLHPIISVLTIIIYAWEKCRSLLSKAGLI